MGSYPTVSPLPARMRAVSFLWRFPSGFPARALPGIGDGGGFTASFRAHEEIILTAQSHRPDCAFGGVIVQLQEAVIQIGPRLGQTGQRISDGLGQWRLAGEFTQLRPKPYLQIIKDRLGVFLLEAVLEKLGLIDHENNEIVKQKGIYKLKALGNFQVDLFPAWDVDGKFYVWPHTFGELDRGDVVPLQETNIPGVKIPAVPERMLELNYGSNWETPNRFWAFNWSKAKKRFSEFRVLLDAARAAEPK